jgi:hypothetical protein
MNASFRLALFVILVAPVVAQEKAAPPRLAVVITVDQMRADFLVRFRPYFGEGGFVRLLAGADYRNCHYGHAITTTAPGHATILSGVNAQVHGIIGNEWLDPNTYIQGNAVEDVDSPLVGLPPRAGRYPNAVLAAKAGRSPRNFLGTTVGDRLKARYGAAAKVYGVADKDRSAILPAGSKADGAFWTEEGVFVTSTYYRAALPDWVQEFNDRRNAAQYFGQTWDRLREKAIYDRVQGPDDMPGELSDDGLSITFPKRVDGDRPAISGAYYNAFDHTPWNNELVAEMAIHTLVTQQLGQDSVPDLLTIGFSQPDKAGHAYGPDSHEIMDTYLRLDGAIAELLNQIDAKVGLAHCVIVLTADHGVCPLPEKVQMDKGPESAGRIDIEPVRNMLNDTLTTAFGALPPELSWMMGDGYGLRLHPAALQARNVPVGRAATELKAAILRDRRFVAAYTRDELMQGGPLDDWGEMMRRSYHPDRSPDVMFVLRENFITRRHGGTNHGMPHAYDTHVPQVWLGAGVTPGVHTDRVAVEDIAPTLAGLLGVDMPPEAKGRRLF